jgi:hypothetical protein
MKRFLVCALGVMLLSGTVYASDGLVYLTGTMQCGGDPVALINIAPSETAVVQLWLEIYDGVQLINADAILVGEGAGPYPDNPDECFDVVGFCQDVPVPFTNPDMQFRGRGPIEGPPMTGDIDDYGIVYADENYPLHAGMGEAGPGIYLLDEIIIHGLEAQLLECPETPTKEICSWIHFALGSQKPAGFKLMGGEGWWYTSAALFDQGTGSMIDPLFICCTPEPASLALLALGGLVAFRRR